MPPRSLTLGFLAAAALLAPLAPARAADLDENYGYADAPQEVPVAQTKVEFGTGWYVRGDLGATHLPGVAAGDEPYGGIYIGPGQTAPGLGTDSSRSINYTASLGGGYQINRWFRSDLVFDFHQPVQSSGQGQSRQCITGTAGVGPTPYQSEIPYTGVCTPNLKARLQSFDVLVNGYVDLGTWYSLTPYVGAGVGLSFGHAQASSQYIQGNGVAYNISYVDAVNGQTYYQNWDRSQSKQYYNFAFAFMGGVAYDIFPHTKLDVGYRYVHLGQVFGASISTQEVRAGLRYMIDN